MLLADRNHNLRYSSWPLIPLMVSCDLRGSCAQNVDARPHLRCPRPCEPRRNAARKILKPPCVRRAVFLITIMSLRDLLADSDTPCTNGTELLGSVIAHLDVGSQRGNQKACQWPNCGGHQFWNKFLRTFLRDGKSGGLVQSIAVGARRVERYVTVTPWRAL